MESEPNERIVFYDHCARLSGAEISMLTTISALDGGATVILGEDGPLVPRLIAAGADVVVLPLPAATSTFSRERVGLSAASVRQSLQVLRYALSLARELRARSATVVVSNSMKGHVIVSAARRFARFGVVFHLHDRVVEEFMSRGGVMLQRTLIRLVPDALVANSRSTMATAPISRRQRIRVVTGGPIERPDRIERRRDPARPLTFGLAGRISPWKGQEIALQAFALAFPTGDAILELAGAPLFGEESHLRALEQMAVRLGVAERVRFLGHVDDLYARLRTWDVALHTSTIPEPFGLVVAQAMAVGTPVIASTEGGPAEMIEDGRTGLLVPPRDARLLAEAMLRLAGEPALRLALGAQSQDAVEDYMPEVAAGRLREAVEAARGRRAISVRRSAGRPSMKTPSR